MASIIPGFEYDIFISYRQKDNKYDGWVTEFVDNLKKEIESTFKEDISIYFDINPHDGLLETHDVDASLKNKLKCLIFIPIVSRTYCDPTSFAWEHEFRAFVEQASTDQFGLKVKLPGGNVSSRVLPVRIHDLDAADIKLCESVLGGVMRGVEFIYKEPGVNRSLTPADDDKKNLNNTRYRNQINKVSLATREILLGWKADKGVTEKEVIQQRISYGEVFEEKKQTTKEKPARLNRIKLLSGAVVLGLLIIAALLIYPKIFKRDKLANLISADGRISIAVMPFQNMTNDTIWDIWQGGIQNELINSLTNYEEFKVRHLESITGVLQSRGFANYASFTPSVAGSISQKLDANIFIHGSIKQAGATIRVNAQLIDSKREELFKSFQIDGTAENILHIIDSLSVMVKNSLIMSKLEQGLTPDYKKYVTTGSPEAYRYYLYGEKAFYKGDFTTAANWYLKSVAIDSNFTDAYIQLSASCGNQGLTDQSRQWCLRLYKKREMLSLYQKLYAELWYALTFETPNNAINYLRQLQELDDQIPSVYYLSGYCYSGLGQYDKAIPEYEKALEIYKGWDSKPQVVWYYTVLGSAYHKTGQYKKEKELYIEAEQDFPREQGLIFQQAILSLTEGDTIAGNRYIEKYISVRKENSDPEINIITDLGGIYSEAGNPDKTEEYLRRALSLEPDNAARLNLLGYFLIDNDRNINEGMDLVDKALKLSPDDFTYLDSKGWGLYKSGKYPEALEILEKSDSLKTYDNAELSFHLEEVKKALSRKK